MLTYYLFLLIYFFRIINQIIINSLTRVASVVYNCGNRKHFLFINQEDMRDFE